MIPVNGKCFLSCVDFVFFLVMHMTVPSLPVLFFFKFLTNTCPFWGHWYPCFGPLGFKVRVGSALFVCFVEVNVMYIPRDPSLVLHVPTSSIYFALVAGSLEGGAIVYSCCVCTAYYFPLTTKDKIKSQKPRHRQLL